MPSPEVLAARQRVQTWLRDPCRFVRETYSADPLGQPIEIDPAQQAILEAIRDYDRVGVRTGRGVGKTACAGGMAIPWFLATHYPALVVTAAGTWSHLADKLWPEIRTWSRNWLLRDAWEYQQLGIYSREAPDSWRVVAASSDRAENVEGYHSPNLLILIDEAKGLPEEIYAALLASLTANGGGVQKMVALSTPPLSGVGWYSRVSNSSAWHLVHVSGLDSHRVSRSYVEEIAHDYGTESPEYQSYVLGEIPQGATDAVIRSTWVEAAQAFASNPDDTRPAVVTCDVARYGEDLTTIGVIRNSKFNLVQFPDRWGWFAGQDLMGTAGRVLEAVRMHRAQHLALDDTGVGGGVTDRLRELQREGTFPQDCQIHAENFASDPHRKDRYNRRKDELWMGLSDALRLEMLALPTDAEIRAWSLPRGSDFKAQLLGPLREYDSRDRIDVLDKRVPGKDKTKNLPQKSPDLAHALILGVSYYLSGSQADPVLPEAKTGEEMLGRMVRQMAERALKPPVVNPFRRG